MQLQSTALDACRAVLEWWEQHQYDVTGEWQDVNVYSSEPDMVSLARVALAEATGGDDAR